MCKILWPGDNTSKQIQMLQPSDMYNLKWLAYVRGFAAIYFVIHVGLVLFFTYEVFWKYLSHQHLYSEIHYKYFVNAKLVVFYFWP